MHSSLLFEIYAFDLLHPRQSLVEVFLSWLLKLDVLHIILPVTALLAVLGDPWMVLQVFNWYSLFWILLEHLLQKVFEQRVVTTVMHRDFRLVEFRFCILYHVVELEPTCCDKRQGGEDQLVESDGTSPNICRLTRVALTQAGLRAKVAVRAGITDQCVIRLLALLLLPRGKGVADSKVCELDIIFIVQQYVIWLDIPVGDIHDLMAIPDGAHQLLEIFSDLSFAERCLACILDSLKEVTVGDVLLNQILLMVIGIIDDFNELQNERMAHFLHDGDLLLHLGPLWFDWWDRLAPQSLLVNYFHCKALLGFRIKNLLDLRKRPLTKLVHDHVLINLFLAISLLWHTGCSWYGILSSQLWNLAQWVWTEATALLFWIFLIIDNCLIAEERPLLSLFLHPSLSSGLICRYRRSQQVLLAVLLGVHSLFHLRLRSTSKCLVSVMNVVLLCCHSEDLWPFLFSFSCFFTYCKNRSIRTVIDPALSLSGYSLLIDWSLGALLQLREVCNVFKISFLFTCSLVENMRSCHRRFVCVGRWITTEICLRSRSRLWLWDACLVYSYLFQHLWEIITLVWDSIVVALVLYYSIVTVFAIGNWSFLVVLAVWWRRSILGWNPLIDLARTISFGLNLLGFGSEPINIRNRTRLLLFAMAVHRIPHGASMWYDLLFWRFDIWQRRL